jgi:type IV pilus assembly protein PilY1
MKTKMTRCATYILAALPFLPGFAQAAATDISRLPMSSLALSAKPNTIFGIDDSGSMDFEIMLTTNDGALWYNIDDNTQRFMNGSGVFAFNSAGDTGGDNNSGFQKYGYLFPNGTGSGARNYGDANNGSHYAVPPIPKYAYMRSSDYNPLYYNPQVTYTPWVQAYIAGALRPASGDFPNSSLTAARSHPWFPTPGAGTTMDLTATLTSTSADWTFRMVEGMTIPASTVISGMKGNCNSSGPGNQACPGTNNNNSWNNTPSSAYPILRGQVWDVSIPYYPATYYVVDSTCTSGADCSVADDGQRLHRYEIKTGKTFPAAPGYPSGRSYAQEMQNFANWFAYFRKRTLLLSWAAGKVFSQINGLRGGTAYFNATDKNTDITMYDFGATAPSANVKTIIGAFYANPTDGGTPTRDMLKYIGDQLHSNTSIIQYACQRNNAFIVTDGFATASATVPASYSQATWINQGPFTTTTANTLADIAAAYYTINPRTDLALGKLTINATSKVASEDKNPNLHMNTYALTLGALGTIFGTPTMPDNAYLSFPTWPTTYIDKNPTSVDDLWHATINGRGSMYSVNDATSLLVTLRQIVGAMLLRSGSDSSVAVSNVNVRAGDHTVYVSNYDGQGWSGELAAYPIDPDTGAVSLLPAAQTWGAAAQLTLRNSSTVLPGGRLIATYDGSAGIPFQDASLPAAYKALLNTPSVTPADHAAVVAYLRGDRSGEQPDGTYRTRTDLVGLLGDIVNAQPTVVSGAMALYSGALYAQFITDNLTRQRVIYTAANDGMLHAFSAANGSELWAYVPSLIAGSLNAYTGVGYDHKFNVDGTPTVGDVCFSTDSCKTATSNTWKTLLVAGLGSGGNGYYALDVTTPATTTENLLKDKVLWEFPNIATNATVASNMGLSAGKPVLAKTAASGWVVLVTSGYNNGTTNSDGTNRPSAGDGKGHLFVLNPATGALIKDIPTTVGSAASPAGLAQISAFADDPTVDPTIDFVYGGDLQGNLWRFDLTGTTVGTSSSGWNAKLLTTLKDSGGTVQPITTTPELVVVGTNRLIIVGTGELMGQTDIASTQTQSLYAVIDDMTSTPTISAPRTALQQKTVTLGAGGIRNIASDVVDFATKKGWFFDLPTAGERITEDINAVFGALVLVTNLPSTTACTAASFIYVVEAAHGGQVPLTGFLSSETPWSGKQLSSSFAAQPVLAMLTNGTLEALTHGSDNALNVTRLPLTTLNTVKRVTWKEIMR